MLCHSVRLLIRISNTTDIKKKKNTSSPVHLKFKNSQTHVLVTQSCPTLCNPKDYSLPGSSVHGILQARILEWDSISFSRESSWNRDWSRVSSLQSDSLPSEPPGKPDLFEGVLLTWQRDSYPGIISSQLGTMLWYKGSWPWFSLWPRDSTTMHINASLRVRMEGVSKVSSS